MECPFIYWNERKVAKQSMLNFFPDAVHFQSDWFHALGCYLAFGGGSAAYLRQPESNWVVPEFANCEADGISKAINRWLRDLVGKVNGVTDNILGTSFRIGATNTIVNHRTCEIWHAIVRGNWDFAGVCTIFDYLLQLNESLSVGLRALTGWSDTRRPCFPPRLIFQNIENEGSVSNMMAVLFDISYALGEAVKQPLLETVFASLIMSLENTMSTYGANHCLVLRIVESAKFLHISDPLTTLLSWGKLIRADWELRNCLNTTSLTTIDGLTCTMESLQHHALLSSTRIHQLEISNKTLLTQNKMLLEKVNEISLVNREALLAIRNFQINFTPRKRKRRDGEQQEEQGDMAQEMAQEIDQSENQIAQQGQEVVVNAFTLMSNASRAQQFTRSTLNKVPVSTIFFEWGQFQLDIEGNWRASTITKQDKNRLKKIVSYVRKYVATEDDARVLRKHISPQDTSSAEWIAWFSETKGICTALAHRLFDSFTQKETELNIPVVKSRNAFVGAAAERCSSILNALERMEKADG